MKLLDCEAAIDNAQFRPQSEAWQWIMPRVEFLTYAYMPKRTNLEQDESQGFHTRTWYGVMYFCAICLGILGLISKDTSVRFYVMWAIILICFAPEINMMMAAYANANRLIELMKNEERKRKAAEARKPQVSEE